MTVRRESSRSRSVGLFGASTGGLLGAGVGAGLMFLLDPVSGRRRRRLALDQAGSLLRGQRDVLDKGARDLAHRAVGTLREVRGRLTDQVDDRVLVERVRAQLGRFASHPAAIHVGASGGAVTLDGPILAHEADRLVRKLGRVRGVRRLVDRLERHERAGHLPALQGAGHVPRPLWRRRPWPPSLRVASIGAGALLGGLGLARLGAVGGAAVLAGAALALRGLADQRPTGAANQGAARLARAT